MDAKHTTVCAWKWEYASNDVQPNPWNEVQVVAQHSVILIHFWKIRFSVCLICVGQCCWTTKGVAALHEGSEARSGEVSRRFKVWDIILIKTNTSEW